MTKEVVLERRVVGMTCDQCGKRGEFSFEYHPDELSHVNADIGSWKRVRSPRPGHDDPLADPYLSLCSWECGSGWFYGYLTDLFAVETAYRRHELTESCWCDPLVEHVPAR